MNREELENYAEKWSAIIREGCEDALFDVLPLLDRISVPAVKMQLLLREYMLSKADKAIYTAEDVDLDETEEIRREMQPLLTEELFSPSMPVETQAVLAEYLIRCIEGSDSFFALFSEALNEYVKDNAEAWLGKADMLTEKALAHLDRESERIRKLRQPEEHRSYGFPAGYPYMDEFEYIDHCIAGDDD